MEDIQEKQSRKANKRCAFSGWERYVVTFADGRYMISVEAKCSGHKEVCRIVFADMEKAGCTHVERSRHRIFRSTVLSTPSTEDSHITWADSVLRIAFVTRGRKRHLLFACPTLPLPDGRTGLDADIVLLQDEKRESGKDRGKILRPTALCMGSIPGMPVSGTLRLGKDMMSFTPDSAWAALDWARKKGHISLKKYPVLSASGAYDGAVCSVSLTRKTLPESSALHDNVTFEGKTYKLSPVVWEAHDHDGSRHARITDAEGKLSIFFTPLFSSQSEPAVIYGRVSGLFTPEAGIEVKLVDFPGFIEERQDHGVPTCAE